MAADRLQPEWILEWLKNPATILPGTRMPAFWPDYPKSLLPAVRRRRRGADPGHPRPPADAARRPEPEAGRDAGRRTRRQVEQAGSAEGRPPTCRSDRSGAGYNRPNASAAPRALAPRSSDRLHRRQRAGHRRRRDRRGEQRLDDASSSAATCTRIRIGRRSNVQDGTIVHVMKDTHPTTIGDDVTVGHAAIIHGCTIEDRCLIGMGAIAAERRAASGPGRSSRPARWSSRACRCRRGRW